MAVCSIAALLSSKVPDSILTLTYCLSDVFDVLPVAIGIASKISSFFLWIGYSNLP